MQENTDFRLRFTGEDGLEAEARVFALAFLSQTQNT
jgi:hypothetical protein